MTNHKISNNKLRCSYSGKTITHQKVILESLAVEYVKKKGYIVVSPRENKVKSYLLPIMAFIFTLSILIPLISSAPSYSDCTIYGTCSNRGGGGVNISNSNTTIISGSNISGSGVAGQVAYWNGSQSLTGNYTFLKNNTGVYLRETAVSALGQKLIFESNSSLWGGRRTFLGHVADSQLFWFASNSILELFSDNEFGGYGWLSGRWYAHGPFRFQPNSYGGSQAVDIDGFSVYPYFELDATNNVVDLDLDTSQGSTNGQVLYFRAINVDSGTPTVIALGGAGQFHYVDHATGTETIGSTLTFNNPNSFAHIFVMDGGNGLYQILYYYDVTIT